VTRSNDSFAAGLSCDVPAREVEEEREELKNLRWPFDSSMVNAQNNVKFVTLSQISVSELVIVQNSHWTMFDCKNGKRTVSPSGNRTLVSRAFHIDDKRKS
jgi:hypothetical protein